MDSPPCEQAYCKLRRGQFSASARVTSFLSIVSRYHVEVDIMWKSRLPFISWVAWKATQHECPDLRWCYSFLFNRTCLYKKGTNLGDVERYLRQVVIATDRMLVVKEDQQFHPFTEHFVIPRQVLDRLLMVIHIYVWPSDKVSCQATFQ